MNVFKLNKNKFELGYDGTTWVSFRELKSTYYFHSGDFSGNFYLEIFHGAHQSRAKAALMSFSYYKIHIFPRNSDF